MNFVHIIPDSRNISMNVFFARSFIVLIVEKTVSTSFIFNLYKLYVFDEHIKKP